jgi:hypothetical protein
MVKWFGKVLGIVGRLILEGFWGLAFLYLALVSVVQFSLEFVPHLVLGLLLALVLLFVVLFLTFWVAVIIHEGGHLLAALALGLRVFSFRVGRVEILDQGKGFQVRWIARPRIPVGWVEAFPRDGGFRRGRIAIFIMGGSLASLLAGVLCFLGVYRINETVVVSYPVPVSTWNKILIPRTQGASWLSWGGLMNFEFLFGLLIPIRRKRYWSDGALLLDLARNRDDTIDPLVSVLWRSLLDGIRPRDWNVAYVEAMLASRTGTPKDAMANLFAYIHARDTGQIELAGQLIDLALTQRQDCPVAWACPAILLEGAYFEGCYRHNAAVARDLLQQAQGGQVEAQTRLRAEAAVLWAEKRFAEAAAKAREGLAVLPQSADPGGALAEGDWLSDILDQCEKHISRSDDGEPVPLETS